MVGCDHVGNSRKGVQQPILETKHRSWSDNGGFGEDISDDFFPTGLGAEEF